MYKAISQEVAQQLQVICIIGISNSKGQLKKS